MHVSVIYKPNTFLYFACGANLWSFRMHMHSPTAEFVAVARLDNYRLEFIKYCSFWGGPSYTLVATANAHVWGVIWRLHCDDMVSLDDQKGVDIKTLYTKSVDVSTTHMGTIRCRTYTKKVNPLPRGDNDPVPVERWPSWTYKEVMINGAIEHDMPEYYIQYLKNLPHNGEKGCLKLAVLCDRYGFDTICKCLWKKRTIREPFKLDVKKKRLAKKQYVGTESVEMK